MSRDLQVVSVLCRYSVQFGNRIASISLDGRGRAYSTMLGDRHPSKRSWTARHAPRSNGVGRRSMTLVAQRQHRLASVRRDRRYGRARARHARRSGDAVLTDDRGRAGRRGGSEAHWCRPEEAMNQSAEKQPRKVIPMRPEPELARVFHTRALRSEARRDKQRREWHTAKLDIAGPGLEQSRAVERSDPRGGSVDPTALDDLPMAHGPRACPVRPATYSPIQRDRRKELAGRAIARGGGSETLPVLVDHAPPDRARPLPW